MGGSWWVGRVRVPEMRQTLRANKRCRGLEKVAEVLNRDNTNEWEMLERPTSHHKGTQSRSCTRLPLPAASERKREGDSESVSGKGAEGQTDGWREWGGGGVNNQ